MKTILNFSIVIGVINAIIACSPQSTPLRVERPLQDEKILVPHYAPIPEQKFEWITEDGGQSQLDFNPQVDILFVTDNSDSMKSAQENLAKNIDKFTAGINKNKMIDYHIGSISVWDSSERYLKAKKDPYQIGELQLVKDSKGIKYNSRFITKTQKNLLASSLAIGVTPYVQGGPEFEEVLAPLAASIEKTGRGAANEDFFRENAQLVVILMTDADDASNGISPESLAQKLFDFKKGQVNKVSVYGVLVKSSDPDQFKDWDLRIHPKYHPECFNMEKKTPVQNGKCKGFGPDRLEQFIIAANPNDGTPNQIKAQHIMSIVSPRFGEDLAKIGQDITVKTLAKDIYLSQRPRVNQNNQLMVRVRYGNQVIPQSTKGGWLYNPEDNLIHLSGDIDYHYKEGARFQVDLVPLTLKN